MTGWAQRARAHFSGMPEGRTDRADETKVASVSAVPFGAVCRNRERVASVSSVGVAAILENRALAADLLAAAMRVCDHHGDGTDARDAMRQDVMNTPEHLRPDLLAYFLQTYGGSES